MNAKILASKEHVLDEDIHFASFVFARKANKKLGKLRKGEKRTEFILIFNCPKQ